MKTMGRLWVTALAVMAVSTVALGVGDRVAVMASGEAPAGMPNSREAAIEDALRRAVETGGGVEVASLSETQDFMLVRDVIYTRSAGLVEEYDVLQENPNQDGAYAVRVRAVISRGRLSTKVAAMKSLIRRKGHPRMMVVGSVDRRPFERRLETEMQGALERRGLTVIDLGMLTENQRRDAERAAKGELDPMKAAMIAREVGADYFVITSVEGAQYPAKNVYGVSLYEVDATAILKIVAVDSSQLLAGEVVTIRRSSRTQEAATRQATTEATQRALNIAVGRVGEHWLEDVDHRAGGQVTVMLDRIDFDRLNGLVSALRQAHTVTDVIIDNADAEGRSQLRVISNATAADLAMVLRSADPGVQIASTSKNRIDVSATGKGGSKGSGDLRMILAVVVGVIAAGLILLAIWKLSTRRARD